MGDSDEKQDDGEGLPPRPPSRKSSFTNFFNRRKSSIVQRGASMLREAQQQVEAHQQLMEMQQTDPDIQRTIHLIEALQHSLKGLRQASRLQQQVYQKELNDMKIKKGAMGRDLWLKQQNNRRNPLVIKEYKEIMAELTTPEEDQEIAVDKDRKKKYQKELTAQAKLLRAQHNDWMTDHQMEMVRSFQQEMIDYLYNIQLPELKQERETTREWGQNQIDQTETIKEELQVVCDEIVSLQERLLEQYCSNLSPEQLEELKNERKEAEHANVESHSKDTTAHGKETPPPPPPPDSLLQLRGRNAASPSPSQQQRKQQFHTYISPRTSSASPSVSTRKSTNLVSAAPTSLNYGNEENA